MRPSQTFDPTLHEEGSSAAEGGCSWHADDVSRGECAGEAVVSFEDDDGRWASGCRLALEHLVEHGEIEPLGQGA